MMPCQRCKQRFKMDENHAQACGQHMTSDGQKGQYKEVVVKDLSHHTQTALASQNHDSRSNNNTEQVSQQNTNSNRRGSYSNSNTSGSGSGSAIAAGHNKHAKTATVWTCCGQRSPDAPPCQYRHHQFKEVMLQVNAASNPKSRIENIGASVVLRVC